MLKNGKKYGVILLFIIFITCLYSFFSLQNAGDTPKSKTGLFLGTVINITIYDELSEHEFENICANIFKCLEEIEDKMSVNIEDSEISKINKNAGIQSVTVSPETFYVVNKGKYYCELSDGAFDITIGPLVNLWGIGSERANLPSKENISATIKHIDYNKVLLDEGNNSIYLMQDNMRLDLGAIAKGYAADVVRDYLIEKNVENAIINLGGNIYALGSRANEDHWNIGIQNPVEPRGAYVGIVHVSNKSVVTSGIYERYFMHEDKRYHHILSPFTGYPVENELASVSIVADQAIDGDGLSTTTFSLGLKNGANLLETIEGVDAIFITKNNEVYITSGLKNNFTLKNSDFTLKKTIIDEEL